MSLELRIYMAKTRIHNLEARGSHNKNLVAKVKRQLRNLEAQQDSKTE